MHPKHSTIPANLRKVAKFLRMVGRAFPGPISQRSFTASAAYLDNVAFYLEQIGDPMGRVADTINRLESEKDQLRAQAGEQQRRADALQQQIDGQQAKLLDDQDLAALDRADNDNATPPVTPPDVTPAT
jgi:chromosome segregation ATPase